MLYAALAVLAILQALDLWTTSRFPTGYNQEANPVMKWIWKKFGFAALVVGKIVVTGGVTAYALTYPTEPFMWGILALCIVIMGLVVRHNLRLARKRK